MGTVVLLCIGTSSGAATAHEPNVVPSPAGAGFEVTPLANGLFEYELPDGFRLQSHGPDAEGPPLIATDPLPPRCAEPSTDPDVTCTRYCVRDLAPCGVEPSQGLPDGPLNPTLDRPLRCTAEPHFHILYAYPRNRPNQLADKTPHIERVMREANARLHRDALHSSQQSRSAEYRTWCGDAFHNRIQSVFLPSVDFTNTNTFRFDLIVSDVRRAGWSNNDDKYLIFADITPLGPTGHRICGQGEIRGDEQPGTANANNGPQPMYAVVYTAWENSTCFTSRTVMHEMGHTMGAVQVSAPYSNRVWHCNDGTDVMCYAEPGAQGGEYFIRCNDTFERFDCAADSYFDASTDPTEWLSTHWNLGSPANRYLAFG